VSLLNVPKVQIRCLTLEVRLEKAHGAGQRVYYALGVFQVALDMRLPKFGPIELVSDMIAIFTGCYRQVQTSFSGISRLPHSLFEVVSRSVWMAHASRCYQ
jgi:hypothetical protein